MTITFPNVPFAAGVPAVLRNPFSASQSPQSLLTGDSPSVSNIANTGVSQWGIFDQSNTQVIVPDSFKSLSYKHGWRIPNYPMEQGAFQSYNKVQMPYEPRVVFTKGGTVADKNTFLEELETIADSIDLYSVVTPEYTYTNVSVEHIDYQRTATNGASLLTVEISLQEIRITTPGAFSNTAAPSGADVTNDGTVQTGSPNSAQLGMLQPLSGGGGGT